MRSHRLGEVLRDARSHMGMTQTEAADALGIDQSRLSAWEREVSVPHHYRLAYLAELYGLDEAELDGLWEQAKLAQLRGPDAGAITRHEVAGIQAKVEEINRRLEDALDRLEALERKRRR